MTEDFDVTAVSPCTENEVDAIFAEELEDYWYVQKKDRARTIEAMHRICLDRRITTEEFRGKMLGLRVERMGKEDFLPKLNLLVSRLSEAEISRYDPWETWKLIDDCGYCTGGDALLAGYVDGALVWHRIIWCRCDKATKSPNYNALPRMKWAEAEALQKKNSAIKLIPTDSDEFLEDVRKILKTPQAISYLRGVLKGHSPEKTARSVIPF